MTNTQSQPVLTREAVEVEIARLKAEEARLWEIVEAKNKALEPLKEASHAATSEWLSVRTKLRGLQEVIVIVSVFGPSAKPAPEPAPEVEAAK